MKNTTQDPKHIFAFLSRAFRSPDFYDNEVEISSKAKVTLQEWRDNPLPPNELLNDIPLDAVKLLDDYYPQGWWSYRDPTIRCHQKKNENIINKINKDKYREAKQLLKKLRITERSNDYDVFESDDLITLLLGWKEAVETGEEEYDESFLDNIIQEINDLLEDD